jgi:UDP-2-acetamido-3-amino-2,3-dideoxy-glucuronate N-acetyltransferase
VSWLHPFKEQKLVVVGDRKMAVFDDIEKKDKLLLFPHSIAWKHNIPIANRAEAQTVSLEGEEPLKNECRHFLECVANREQPRTDGDEGLRVLEVLQKCQTALEGRKEVKPDPLRGEKGENAKPFFAHESACIDDGVEIGKGTSIWHFSHVLKGSQLGKACKVGQNVVIGPNALVGNGVKIQNNVSVYEGVTLEDSVFCGPSMVFTNVFNPRSEIPRMTEVKQTYVKRGATLGANCTIMCGVIIGKYAFVGAGAVVTKTVPDYALVVGNPAINMGWICECGVKLSWTNKKAICTCGREYSNGGDVVKRINETQKMGDTSESSVARLKSTA